MEKKDISIKRLEVLKNAMILNHLENIDFNNEEERTLAYESLLYKTIINGEFDDIFVSDELEGLEKEERQRIFDLSRKYSSLCFYRGDFEYWLDSVEGVTLGNEDVVCEALLRNYNYLIRLTKNGGEDVLKFLNKFQSNDPFDNNSVIASLLIRFYDEDILEKVLIEMVSSTGLYKNFTDTQKIIMCDYPDGVLYKKNDNGDIELISNEKEISKIYMGEDNYLIKNIDSEAFKEIVEGIYSDYIGAIYKK